MKRDSRLSAVLHALLHMAEHETRTGLPMTSDQLAVCLSTNPVVVRRTMAGLREQGVIVRHFKQERIAQFLRISIGTPEQNQALIDGLGEL